VIPVSEAHLKLILREWVTPLAFPRTFASTRAGLFLDRFNAGR
jgi:hypothetical protein